MTSRVVPGAVVGAALAAAAVLLTAAPAHAHDTLVRTSPADGARVKTVPASVELVFDKPVLALGTAIRVAGPAGDVQDGEPTVVDATVTQPLRAGSPSGSYTVTWRATSVDGHPVTGSYAFEAGASAASTSPSATPTASPSDSSNSAAVAVKRDGRTSYLEVGIAAAAGAALGAAYVLWNRSRRKREGDDGTAS